MTRHVDSPPPSAPLHRRAARVLLLDAADRVLLLLGKDPGRPEHRYWFTVGGGIDPGESSVQAAVRELLEETGLSLSVQQVHGPIRQDVIRFEFDGRHYEQQQEFFVARVPSWDVDVSGHDAIERTSIDGWRWWSATEIEVSDELFYPTDLPSLLRTGAGKVF